MSTPAIATYLCALALGAGAAEHLGDLGKFDGLAIHVGGAANTIPFRQPMNSQIANRRIIK
jgi:hypothetical protein